jgi:hypothetical protein
MKYKIEIPEYLTIGDYQAITNLEHLSEMEKMVEMIATITHLDRDVINKWEPNQLSGIVESVFNLMEMDSSTFYPIIEWNDVLYGYRPLSKMKLGEYIDLERLCKDPVANLDQITAILYRPITKNKLKGIEFGLKQGFKIAKGKTENLFKYYDIKDYDSEQRIVDADTLKDFPVGFALGALGFFLVVGTKSLNNTNNSLVSEEMTTMMNKQMEILINSIGDGLQQYIRYQRVPSLQSLETRVSLI